jgi:hypothetical protein
MLDAQCQVLLTHLQNHERVQRSSLSPFSCPYSNFKLLRQSSAHATNASSGESRPFM